jgi:hypothetical protein
MLWAAMVCWAIMGSLCVLLGVVSLFVNLPDWLSFRIPEVLMPYGLLGIMGVIFVWLWLSGYIKFAGE